jgi:hypothetical protein
MCRHYNRCLDRAIEMDWKGFACSECQDYELEAVGDQPHWQEQEWRAAYLLLKIAATGPQYDSWAEPRYHQYTHRTGLPSGKGLDSRGCA